MKEILSTPLKTRLEDAGITQGAVCRETGLSKSTVNRIVNVGEYPKRGAAMYVAAIEAMLAQKNKTPCTPHAEGLSSNAEAALEIPVQPEQPLSKQPTNEKEDPMLLRKQTLAQDTKKHFKLFKDPFTNDVQEAKDVFLTPDIRYVRESMWQTVRLGGALVVIGESGSGKSTLREDLLDRIVREQANVIVVEPYVLAMEENDAKGQTLKSAAIAEAIITTISPLTKPKRGSQARFAQLHNLLKESDRAGNRHVLIIEEAHCLPKPTLKHLKRFWEVKSGFKELLSIILIAQPELREKLSERDPEVREVVQRFSIVELMPLDNNLSAYLDFKLKRVGSDISQVFDKGAIDAIRTKFDNAAGITGGKARAFGKTTPVSLLYPLAVANLVSAAMNLAVSLGVPTVTADLVMEA